MKILLSLFLIGFVSIISQTILIRELLVVFLGNELTIGIIISNWVLTMGLGSYMFGYFADISKNKLSKFLALKIILFLYLPVSVMLTRNIKNLIIAPGLFEIFYISFLILLPISFPLGAMFSLGCGIYDDSKRTPANISSETNSISIGYILDSFGDLIGGILLTYFFLVKTSSTGTFFILTLLLIISTIIISENKKTFTTVLLIFSLFFFTGLIDRLNNFSIKNQWKKYNLMSYENSVYNNIVSVEKDAQRTIFINGLPIVTLPTPDIIAVEEHAHFPMLFHNTPKKILIMGGVEIIKELLKYPVKKITYVELDPLIIKTVKNISKENIFENKRINLIYSDARKFVSGTTEKYDLVLINISYPLSLELNRYYTLEFFEKVKTKLSSDGIIFIALPGSLTYLNEELKNLNLSIYSTLKKVFKSVKVIPGDSMNIYLSSLRDLNKINEKTIITRMKKYKLKLNFITPEYIKYKLDRRWSDWFFGSIKDVKEEVINQDFKPIGTFYAVSHWTAIYSKKTSALLNYISKINSYWIIISIFLIGIFLVLLLFIKKESTFITIPYVMFTTGFSGMCYTILLILSFQIFYGYLYYKLGLLLAIFMFGLGLGAVISKFILKKTDKLIKFLIYSEIGIIIFSFLLPNIIEKFGHMEVVFFLLSFTSAVLVGMEFPFAVQSFKAMPIGKKVGLLYGLDLLGAFFAAIIVSVWFLPLYGFTLCCYFIISAKLISIVMLLIWKQL